MRFLPFFSLQLQEDLQLLQVLHTGLELYEQGYEEKARKLLVRHGMDRQDCETLEKTKASMSKVSERVDKARKKQDERNYPEKEKVIVFKHTNTLYRST